MTREQQHDWVYEQMHRDPYWAETESNIRRQAVEVQRQLDSKSSAQHVSTYVLRPSSNATLGMETIRVEFVLQRYGGLEERLLIEEQLRRAIYDL